MRDPGDEATAPLPLEKQKRTSLLQSGWTIPTNVRVKVVHHYTPMIAIPLAGTTRTPMSLNNVFIRISNDPKTKIDTQSNSETDNLLGSFWTFLSLDFALKLHVQNRLSWGLPAGTVITKETKEPNNRVLLGILLFGCIVSFVVRNLWLST